MAVSSFVTVGLGALAQQVRSAQVEGTLEALLSTPTSIYTILVGNSLWVFLTALAEAVVLLGVGVVLLKLQFSLTYGLLALLVLGLTFVAFLAIGMLSAAFVMVFKRGNPVEFVFGTSSFFLGGILFPVEVLPQPLQHVSRLLPITHAVKAIRELLLAEAEIQQIFPLVANLVAFIAVLAPASILVFRYAVRRAKKDGSLVQY
jgi:ABC-2 type transport system permease protein